MVKADEGVNGDSGVDGVDVMAVWTTTAGGSSAGHANEYGDLDRSGEGAFHRLPQSQATWRHNVHNASEHAEVASRHRRTVHTWSW